MANALIAAVIAAVTLVTSWALVPTLIRLARQKGLVHPPTQPRQVHTSPLPRLGGIVMFVAFVSGIAVSFTLPVTRFPEEIERILLLVIGAAIIVAVMAYDDLVGIAPVAKLAWQIGAAGVIILPRLRGPDHGLVIEQFNNPFGGAIEVALVLAIPLTVLWIVGMMNTLNWVDGLDGLAGSITLVAASVLFVHTFFRPEGNPQFTISLLAVALGATVLGFLPHNWHPARIIMGDSGSMFLGYALAVIAIIGGAKIATALLALWLPIVDVAWVIIYRILHGRSPLEADRGHLHHRLLDLGWSQQQVVLFFAGLSVLLGAAALIIPWPELKLLLLVGGAGLGIILLAALARRTSSTFGQRIPDATRRT
jgi:UDP-GlcNAc:undecaprenyl-phosphate/decaprenyl-phosphate GlcNAc-1-phosphate transferase